MRRGKRAAPLWMMLAGGWALACQSGAAQRAAGIDTTPVTREGRVLLRCEPPDAEASLDGVPVGRCSDYSGEDRGLPVGRGDHTLEFRKHGFFAYRTEVAPDRTQAVVHVRLTPTSDSP